MSDQPSITLSALPIGKRAKVVSVANREHAITQRLLSMGIVAGSEVEVQTIAPLGDPIQIHTLGYKLSLRKDEAAHVQVRLV